MQSALSLLIVEDNEDLVELLQESLADLHCDVSVANSAAAALKILSEKSSLNALVTDVQLPDGNGHTVALAARDMFPKCFIIYMSAYHEIAPIVEAVKQGHAVFLKKPFSPSVLKELIVDRRKL